jgi:hypothetical protein
MVQDAELTKAVATIPQRSERQSDLQKLVGAFVDVGIMPQVRNVNNQVIYGRRGTGKTHVLKVLSSELASAKSNAVCYIDGRTLGSTSQFTDASIPMSVRCMALFRDILGEIHNTLLDHLITLAPAAADAALDELSSLAGISTEQVSSMTAQSIDQRGLTRATEKAAGELSLGSSVAKAELRSDREHSDERETKTSYKVTYEDKIIFPSVSYHLKQLLGSTHSNLFILLDEWSSLPLDVQPYLAEFFKRAFLPLASVTVKIASLEYRSDFGHPSPTGLIGFEMGADVSAALDIDDYYVYDRNPERITNAFSDMLFKHLRNELSPSYLDELGIKDGLELASRLFSERAVFEELVRASEGVARDLINIFSKAYFIAHRKGKEKIERSAILEAARQWFEQDKETNLDDHLRLVLRRIIDQVIGDKKARSFLLSRDLSNNPVVQRLFDLRVLHLVQRGYADKDRPGVRYDIYTLDYGTYVDLLNTSKRPDLGFLAMEDPDPVEFIVPFDDKRSIRRIILTESTLA